MEVYMSNEKATKVPKVVIDRVRVPVDPPIDIFVMELSSATGTWGFTTASPHDLQNIIEGIQAGVAMMGDHFQLPEIPTQPTKTLSRAIGGMNGLFVDTVDRVLDSVVSAQGFSPSNDS
jgi:hypothetical protein